MAKAKKATAKKNTASIEFTEQEANALVNLVNIAVKTVGINTVASVAPLLDKFAALQNAFQNLTPKK